MTKYRITNSKPKEGEDAQGIIYQMEMLRAKVITCFADK